MQSTYSCLFELLRLNPLLLRLGFRPFLWCPDQLVFLSLNPVAMSATAVARVMALEPFIALSVFIVLHFLVILHFLHHELLIFTTFAYGLSLSRVRIRRVCIRQSAEILGIIVWMDPRCTFRVFIDVKMVIGPFRTTSDIVSLLHLVGLTLGQSI